MQLSKKQKTFFGFFSPFLKYTTNFEHLDIKDGPDSLCISEITDRKKCS